MNLEGTRDALAAAAATHAATAVHGYREPPAQFLMPAFVVLDPQTVEYHRSWSSPGTAILHGRLIVPSQLGSARLLDQLLAQDALPRTLEQFDSEGVWEQCSVLRKLPGSYVDYQVKEGDRTRTVGLSADIEIFITYP